MLNELKLSEVDVCNKDVDSMIPTLTLLIDDEGTNAIVVSTIMEESRDSSTIQFILPFLPPQKQRSFADNQCLSKGYRLDLIYFLLFWLVRIPHVAPWSWTCDLCYDMGWERVSRDSNNRSKYKIGNYVSSWLQATNGCIPTLTGFPTAICSLSGDDSDSMSTDRYCWDTNGNVAKHSRGGGWEKKAEELMG